MATALFPSLQNTPVFQTGVSLVHVDAEVLDADKRPVMDLAKSDFRLLDSGQEQTIAAFSQGEQPLDLILLFDVSGSMRRQVKKVAEVARQGLRELRKGDRVGVMVFTRKSKTIASFSDDLEVIERAIQSVLDQRFFGGTRIQDAVQDAARSFFALHDGGFRRRAILVLTDNVGMPSNHKTQVIENLWEADALLSGLVLHNWAADHSLNKLLGKNSPGGVDDLVRQTGGDFMSADDLATAFPEIMRRIRNRYTLYYKLPEGPVGSLRKVEVQLSPQTAARFQGARVLSRQAYRLSERDQYGFSSRR